MFFITICSYLKTFLFWICILFQRNVFKSIGKSNLLFWWISRRCACYEFGKSSRKIIFILVRYCKLSWKIIFLKCWTVSFGQLKTLKKACEKLQRYTNFEALPSQFRFYCLFYYFRLIQSLHPISQIYWYMIIGISYLKMKSRAVFISHQQPSE